MELASSGPQMIGMVSHAVIIAETNMVGHAW